MPLESLKRHVPAQTPPNARTPLLVLLHGRGDSPRNFIHLTDELQTPRREIAFCAPQELNFGFDRGWQWFEAFAGDGDTPELGRGILDAASLVARELEDLNAVENAPQRRFVLSGFSQGGMICYALALHYPQLFSYVLPIAGLLPPQARPEALPPSLPPIHALHGLADPLVQASRAQELHLWLERKGAQQSFRGYEGVEHTVSAAMHKDYLRALEDALS